MRKLLLVLSIFWCCNANAQNNPIRFQHLTAKDGLSQGHILCMIQDSEGYIWAGTYHGLNRYNGYSFDVFYADSDNPNSLFINVIFSLFEDRDGNIWCGTWGIDIYDKKTETFRHLAVNEGKNTLSAGEVSAIAQDKEGNMWFATQGGGINKLDFHTKEIAYYKADETIDGTLKSNYINDILIDRNQVLWAATEDGGLSRINLKDETIVTYQYSDNDPNSLPSNNISCLFEDKDDHIWIGDTRGNLFLYNPVENNFTSYDFSPVGFDLRRTRIMQISQDISGNLLLATNGSGLIIFDYINGSSTIYLHESDYVESIISNETYSILIDKTNTIFIGSYGRGISKYSPYSRKFNVYSIPKSSKIGGDVNAFTDAIEDYKGHLIAGTYNGFVVFDLKTRAFQHHLPGTTYEENKILTIALAPDSTIWMGSMKSLHRYDKNLNKIRSYVFAEQLKDHSIYSIEFDHQNNLWVALFTKGLLKIPETEWKNKHTSQLDFTLYVRDNNDPTTISGNQHWIVYHDNDSTLWIGGVGGLDRYNYNQNNFTRVFYPGTVKTMDFDSKGTLWMGTIGNGLYSYDLTSGEYKRYTVEDGLSHSFIYGIVIDSNDNIWISSELGLSRFTIETEKFRNYDERDGLPDDHFDDKSESMLSGGRIYMGTNNGFIVFKPEDIKDDTSSSKVVLTSLKINNRSIEFYRIESKDTVINVPLGQVSKIELKPDQRDITFEFAALHFAAPHKIQYKYYLKGYDKEWIMADAVNRTAKYTNLDGGVYTFMVKATNSDDKWTEEPLEISIVVKPPFYQTKWFFVSIAGLLIIITVLIFRWRMASEIKQKEKLAKLVDQRTIEITNKNKLLKKTADDLKELNELLIERQQRIEEQTEELAAQRDELALINTTKDKLFSIIAHDLKNPFNVIMGYSELLVMNFNKWDDEKKLKFLLLLKESSQSAYNLLENLLQWSRSQSGTLSFNPIPKGIDEILELVMPEALDFAKKKKIMINTKIRNGNVLIQSDINMLCVILRNLIFNAIKFSKQGDKINILVEKYDSKSVIFTIHDQGVGMSEEELEYMFQLQKSKTTIGTGGEKGTGLGLILCKDFIDAHKGKIWAESKPDEGTTFHFTIPLAV